MDKLIFHCKKILKLLDKEYSHEKNYSGAVKNIYEIICEVLINAENNTIYNKDIDFFSLIRTFADETTDYLSPILFELEIVEKILNALKA